jgi:hypothetical protein
LLGALAVIFFLIAMWQLFDGSWRRIGRQRCSLKLLSAPDS